MNGSMAKQFAASSPISSARRLVTYYLQKDGEPEYHLGDEPFDYDKVKG